MSRDLLYVTNIVTDTVGIFQPDEEGLPALLFQSLRFSRCGGKPAGFRVLTDILLYFPDLFQVLFHGTPGRNLIRRSLP